MCRTFGVISLDTRSAMTLLLVAGMAFASEPKPATRSVQFAINDAQGQPVPCRIHLVGQSGKPIRAPGQPFWHDHFVCSGRVVIPVGPGQYRYEIERGPEYRRLEGTVDVAGSRDEVVTLELRRLADLASEGWYSGDLHIHRPVEDMPLLMRAEDLHVAPVITWWNQTNPWKERNPPARLLESVDGNRFYHVMAGEDERGGGALLFFHLERPLEITRASREYPSAMKFVNQARRRDPRVWVDIEKPFWWDVPIWLASGQADSIGIANNHMCRSQMLVNEAWGRPRDAKRLPDPLGNGYWSQEIYYHILNCGIHIPPSAGSASGVLPNPVGYDRVYVHVDGPMDYAQWWEGLKAGRLFVTNGPLLLCKANGEFPGHVFKGEAGHALDLKLELKLITSDRVPRIEIIKDGLVDSTMDMPDSSSHEASARVRFTESGWFLVRAIAENPKTFRFASTAPFYVELGQHKRRISRGSVQFFLDWLNEREHQLRSALTDAVQLREVLAFHEEAMRYWRDLASQANAD
ncbi:MAG TPA: CehA/McbA family metallohydrolase [Phycisphaerae bacterium]|nr:CehA/McbA family metallohydrolase [Phycisphaerae bacterium]HRY70018.1 CehA/McbA family metallohydrolase [Phycisphaerae bacterium]HSA27227.1 CehA/McbA family metallohydrolase [Phycisphaerae bacterium]